MIFYEQKGFICADGKASTRHPCQKKLCFVATDKAYLIAFLERLLERDDCFWVKYSPESHDGMYLGRAFLTDPRAVGEVWRDTKHDPKLFCSVQDDDFVLTFRDT